MHRPLSSTALHHHRRILHQPFFPQDSCPHLYPLSPPHPQISIFYFYPQQHPIFPSYPSPPPTPAPASFASFLVNISSLNAPHSKSKSESSKLIGAAVATVGAAVALVALAVFLHLRKRNRTQSSSSYNHSKTRDPIATAPPLRFTVLQITTTFESFRDLHRAAQSSCTWALW